VNFEAFKNLVDKVKENHPIWFGLDADQTPNEFDLLEAEEQLNTKLPDDYKNFIFEYGGGYFAFSNVYSLEKGSDWNLVNANYNYHNMHDNYILVSENGLGDFYGFKTIDGVCCSEIYFYDHEVNNWQETQYSNLFDYLEKSALSNE
jgi:hypothetical protein